MKLAIRLFTLLIFASFALLSCNKKLRPNSKKYQKLYISVETTPCFGTCPVYKMDISAHNLATLNAVKFTEPHQVTGEYNISLTDEETFNLLAEAYHLPWDSFEKEYRSNYSDLPGAIITFSKNAGDTTSVFFERDFAPQELEQIAKKIERFRTTLDWGSAKEILE